MRLLASLLFLLAGTVYALEIHFIDVGQGDAVLIRDPGGNTVLYDGGISSRPVLDYLETVGVDSLDLVIASHADADHIGGLAGVIARYPPRYFIDNGVPHTTETYLGLLRSVSSSGASYLGPSHRRIGLGDTTLIILPSSGRADLGQNDNSIGVLITYGEFSALLTGDAGHLQMNWWHEQFPDLLGRVDLYKSSHHGSSDGDPDWLLEILQPRTVVISSGAGNSYGHPSPAVLARHASSGSDVYRTDERGSISIHVSTDGQVEVRTQRSAPVLQHVLALAAPPALVGALQIECILFNPAGRDDGNEWVTLVSRDEVAVTGWLLRDEAGHTFALPELTLQPGDRIRIPNHGRPTWNNDGDTAYLFDASGNLIDSFAYSGRGEQACR